MIQKDNKYIENIHEIKKQLSQLQAAVHNVIALEMKAKREGYWNNGYVKDVFKKFIAEISFSIEEIEHYIEDEILSSSNDKKIPKYILDNMDQIAN